MLRSVLNHTDRLIAVTGVILFKKYIWRAPETGEIEMRAENNMQIQMLLFYKYPPVASQISVYNRIIFEHKFIYWTFHVNN